QTLIVRFITEQLITDETNITQGGLVVRHSDKPLLMNPGTNDRAVAESIASSTRQSRMPCGQTGV
ncbi:hypothetical protein OFN55_36460, partial [Escherichia coli]|nr:hypothetical protein [Escherichia coli]